MSSSPSDTRNRLARETSPYLLQHAGNPVHWYPWGNEALARAGAENKMLLVSIGYAACHWCHVMEHESFEDDEVARIMNENFVCIKVDREERPDVDQVYMSAVQLLTGSGGWPLNCFALPDGSPVYGGTYFPRENWIQVLNYMAGIYKNETDKAVQQAESLKKGVAETDFVPSRAAGRNFTATDVEALYSNLVPQIDTQYGGLGKAPKFPMPSVWLFLLRYHHFTSRTFAIEQTLHTLDRMAVAGIHDQLGGGFSRYATDAAWNIPHFEKMLYDNGQLMSLYSEAWQLTRNDRYRDVVYRMAEFVSRELRSPKGAFFSSIDADSEGEEGKFYVWEKREIEERLDVNADIFCSLFNITDEGNWEDRKNILYTHNGREAISERTGLDPAQLRSIIRQLKKILFEAREQRIHPTCDDKILTGWNAIMIKGFIDAYRAFGEDDFLDKALVAARFILDQQAGIDNSLMRNYKDGKSTIPAFLDDYALVIDALVHLYKATFDENWLMKADTFMTYCLDHFSDPASAMFFYTSDIQTDVIVRKMELTDHVIPSSNSVMANNLFKLGKYLGKQAYIDRAGQMLANVWNNAVRHSPYYTNWGILLLNLVVNPAEVALTGTDIEVLRKELEAHYLPEIILTGSVNESDLPLLRNRTGKGKNQIYVCHNYTCQLPVESTDRAVELIRKKIMTGT